MTYCRDCGAQLPEDARYCPICGKAVEHIVTKRIPAASWGDRFLAWLIDVIIVGIFLSTLKSLFLLSIWPIIFPIQRLIIWIPFSMIGLDNVIYFIYWTLMEGISGQSLGKMVLNLRVTRSDGAPLTLSTAAIESFGKAFMLPLDCLVGWIFYPTRRQRLFNYLSGTIVTKDSGREYF
ncbi:MAG: RDD family protein [Nitrososphaerota archaeon]|nr:RDD family protein [Candidatus Bathyarchaeota archaeon]MDW8048246.1 RDD family protein [Nitrososphaerota archaeon]